MTQEEGETQSCLQICTDGDANRAPCHKALPTLFTKPPHPSSVSTSTHLHTPLPRENSDTLTCTDAMGSYLPGCGVSRTRGSPKEWQGVTSHGTRLEDADKDSWKRPKPQQEWSPFEKRMKPVRLRMFLLKKPPVAEKLVKPPCEALRQKMWKAVQNSWSLNFGKCRDLDRCLVDTRARAG